MNDENAEQLNLDAGIDASAEEIAEGAVHDVPGIGWGERLIIYPLLLFVDFVELMGDLIQAVPYVGLPIYLLLAGVSLLVTLLIQFYLFLKHIKNYTFLAVGLAGSLPLVGAFFFKTVAFLVTDIMNSNKTIAGAMDKTPAGKVAKIASKV